MTTTTTLKEPSSSQAYKCSYIARNNNKGFVLEAAGALTP
jgi:hypothetical protein